MMLIKTPVEHTAYRIFDKSKGAQARQLWHAVHALGTAQVANRYHSVAIPKLAIPNTAIPKAIDRHHCLNITFVA